LGGVSSGSGGIIWIERVSSEYHLDQGGIIWIERISSGGGGGIIWVRGVSSGLRGYHLSII
jgi:hypothetical protein